MKYIFVTILSVVLIGCHSDNPFISKELAEQILQDNQPKAVEYVAAIVSNEIYWFRNFQNAPKKIAQTINGNKKNIRVSHDHSKFAFVVGTSAVAIMDTTGVLIGTSNYGVVRQMDWSVDDKTIWMLVNNEIKFYGPTMDLPDLEIESTELILSAVVTPTLDVFYIVQSSLSLGRYTERVEFRGHDGSSRSISKPDGEFGHMQTLRLSKDKKHFVLGYAESLVSADLVKIAVYNVDEEFPLYSEEIHRYIDAVYDDNSSYIVMAKAEGFFDKFYLVAQYLKNEATGPDNNKYQLDYSAAVGSIWVDWK